MLFRREFSLDPKPQNIIGMNVMAFFLNHAKSGSRRNGKIAVSSRAKMSKSAATGSA